MRVELFSHTSSQEKIREVEVTRGASLPHRNHDPIARLHAHYFEPSDFMLEHFLKLDRQAATKGLSRAKVIERRYYLMFWLSSLYVVLEGMESMPIAHELEKRPLEIPGLARHATEILADFEEHRLPLRLLRNAQAHYQKNASKHLQFFDSPLRIGWARTLHVAISRLLSDYRIQCALVCAFAGRTSEIDLKRTHSHPSRHKTYFSSA